MPPRQFKIAPTLAFSIGFLIFLSMSVVLYVQWSTNRKIIAELGGNAVFRALEIVDQGISAHLDPTRRQVEAIAHLLESATIAHDDATTLLDHFTGALTAFPQISAIVLIDGDGPTTLLRRGLDDDGLAAIISDVDANPTMTRILAEAKPRTDGYWGEPLYGAETKRTFVNYRRPLWRGNEFFGVLAAGVEIDSFSRFAAAASKDFESTVFVLYGENRVLAHPAMVERRQVGDIDQPTISIAALGDPVLKELANAVPTDIVALTDRDRFDILEAAGDRFFLLRRDIGRYGDQSFTAGILKRTADADSPLRLMYLSAWLGAACLAIAILCAAMLSRAVARPILRVTEGVTKIGQVDVADIKPAPTSWIREVSNLAISFNGMLGGLRQFETYVPRSLVRRLIAEGHQGNVASEERILTVMFTDIAGFTSMCEGMTAIEVADFINQHLSLLAECVEAEGGTIDKYIGDALMAFWGAPEQLENTALGACRAARKMAAAVRQDNVRRQAEGQLPIGLRIGIHTGPLVVGNIGAPSRINYTVVGDTVNTAQRLETLGKEVDADSDVIVLLSSETKALLSPEFSVTDAGAFSVKGKEEEVSVHRLEL